jgi:transposase, IS5 family
MLKLYHQVQTNSSISAKKRASTPKYVSPKQLTLCGFETPFEQSLTSNNRWVHLSKLIPWDKIVIKYDMQFKSTEGRPPISGRVVIGAVIIKHILNLTDRETILQIQENVFMQYFLGYSSFTNDAPFSPSLFVEIRERLSLEVINSINDIIVANSFEKSIEKNEDDNKQDDTDSNSGTATKQEDTTGIDILSSSASTEDSTEQLPLTKNAGKLLMDATVAPQNITYPTDLKLLNASRIKSEELIDKLYNKLIHGDVKVRTYRQEARKEFLNTAKKKSKSAKEIYKANGTQLRYLKRNLAHIVILQKAYEEKGIKIPLKERAIEYLEIIKLVYEQQYTMYTERVKKITDRIVNIHQPYVRPIVRGKEGKKVEFGSKLQVSMVKGFAFIDKLSWDNFNEGQCLMDSVEKYKIRMGYYPAEVLADQIYCNRENRKKLKELNIRLMAKPLGRPKKEALQNHLSPGERNPIEGKFGQAKVGYGLANISAKLKTTSQSWIATIFLVLNLVNLTRLNLLYLYQYFIAVLAEKKLKLSY